MLVDQERGQVALELIADHHARNQLFPAEAFHDFAWHMLLATFVAHANGRSLTEAELLSTIKASKVEAHRWLYCLGRDGHLLPRTAGDDVVLTSTAIVRLRVYLDQIASSSRSVDRLRSFNVDA